MPWDVRSRCGMERNLTMRRCGTTAADCPDPHRGMVPRRSREQIATRTAWASKGVQERTVSAGLMEGFMERLGLYPHRLVERVPLDGPGQAGTIAVTSRQHIYTGRSSLAECKIQG